MRYHFQYLQSCSGSYFPLCGGDGLSCLFSFLCVWFHPCVMLSLMFLLKFNPLPIPPAPCSLPWIGHCLRRAGGLLKPAGSLFFFVVLVGFWRGSDTVMHSVLLPGVSRSSSKVRLCTEYKVTWTSSWPHAPLLFSLSVGTHEYMVQVSSHRGDFVLILFLYVLCTAHFSVLTPINFMFELLAVNPCYSKSGTL